MKVFRKKTEITLVIISIVALSLSTFLILLSNNLMYLIQDILETKVFHREFEISKWADTINALIAFPIFFAIFIDSLIFLKLSNKAKIILISIYSFVIFLFIGICSAQTSDAFMDSDMASELLLAKECYINHSFWPRTWNYSTEIRMLNTQLFTAPLFIFTSNFHVIKTVSVLLICLLLPFSLMFLLHELRIKDLWVKLLSALIILSPWSFRMWEFVHFGSYYIPHFAIAFIYLALYISISYNFKDNSTIKNKICMLCFFGLAFISGLSGIRYILYFELPLALTISSYAVSFFVKENKEFNLKDFILKNKPLAYSLIALFLGGTGYIFNTLVLSNLYSFSQFNTTAFTTIGDVPLREVFETIITTFGYKNKVSVFTSSGIINVLVYIAIVFFFICLFNFFKVNTDESRKIFITFFAVMAVLNTFFFVNTEWFGRYMTFVLIFIVPTLAIFINEEKLGKIKRYITALCFSVVLICSTFITFQSVLCTKPNNGKTEVTKFLMDNNFSFGYGTFWNANVFTYLSNDKIHIANLKRKGNLITENFECDKWLTPERYYKDDFGETNKVFLIVSLPEYNESHDARIFSNGTLIYNDDYYRVYEYKNNKSFKSAF